MSPLNLSFLVQVRNADSSWRDVRKQLRKDQRWDLAESLDREEKEKLFDEHMDELGKKNKEMFHKLLEETSGVSLSMHFLLLLLLFCIDHNMMRYVSQLDLIRFTRCI